MAGEVRSGVKAYLAPDVILRLLINKECIAEIQMLMRQDLHIISSNFAFFEAISCVEKRDELNLEAMRYMLEKVEFIKDEAGVEYTMTPQRKEKLRKLALK